MMAQVQQQPRFFARDVVFYEVNFTISLLDILCNKQKQNLIFILFFIKIKINYIYIDRMVRE